MQCLGLVFAACGLEAVGLVLTAHWLSCSVACRIFLDQGLNQCPHIGKWILIHCATREVLDYYFDFSSVLSPVPCSWERPHFVFVMYYLVMCVLFHFFLFCSPSNISFMLPSVSILMGLFPSHFTISTVCLLPKS